MAKRNTIPDLPPNSHKKKEKQRLKPDNLPIRDDIQRVHVKQDSDGHRVIATTTRVRKPSTLSRIVNAFVGDSPSDIGAYIVEDVVVPATKSLIENMISTALNMFLYGEGGGNRRSQGRFGEGRKPIVSYSSYFSRGRDRYGRTDTPRHRSANIQTRGVQDRLDGISFEDGGEASDILLNLMEAIDEFGCVSVATYLEFAELQNLIQHTDNGYGWYNLDRAKVVTTRHGYEIDFPVPVVLDA